MIQRKILKRMLVAAIVALFTLSASYAQLSLGADVVSRYVWRGADFGNSPSIQPGISYSLGNFEVGAWSAWSVNGDPSGNENDLYLSASLGPVGLTLTDYFFPVYGGEDDFFNYGDTAGVHTLEIGLSYGIGALSVMGAINVSGDADNSKYVELGYELLSSDEMSAGLVVGLGDGFYTSEGGFGAVHVGINASKDSYSASYIINPDGKTSFLVFGVSF